MGQFWDQRRPATRRFQMDGYHVHLIIVSDSGLLQIQPRMCLKMYAPQQTCCSNKSAARCSLGALAKRSVGWVGNRGIVTSATDRLLAMFRDKSWRDIHVTKTAVDWKQVNHVAHSLFFTTETKARTHTHTRARSRGQNKTRKKKKKNSWNSPLII